MTQQAITDFEGPHRFLSNFWMAPVTIYGETYPSVEHAYQAWKSDDPAVRQQVAALKTPGEAKKAGKTIARRADFEQIKLQLMRYLVWYKFATHGELKAKLLATGTAQLVEGNDWGDTFWGVVNGQGHNHLGRILEDVRSEIRNGAPVDKVFIPGPNRIFVFGSNRGGIHGGGAARTAHQLYGAIWGQGEGLQGSSYALPTKDEKLESLQIPDITQHVQTFLQFAAAHPELYFFVTRIGCGFAGFKDADMAPLFKDASANCELPEGWDQP